MIFADAEREQKNLGWRTQDWSTGDKTWHEKRTGNRYRNRDPAPTAKSVKNMSGMNENRGKEKNCSRKTKPTDRSSNEGRPRTQEGNSDLDAIQTRTNINSNKQCITQPKGELLRSSKINEEEQTVHKRLKTDFFIAIQTRF
jgi:hypothetical protein